ncbi:MAG: YciI family protein, partial [Oceanospirillaceae bacterium]|nr:YciI family protein [Oceanospirillaceae bacterium]
AMNPLKDTHHIAPDGVVSSGSGTQMSGFTIIEAASIEAAVEITITCPFTEIGGSLEVSELVQMSD